MKLLLIILFGGELTLSDYKCTSIQLQEANKIFSECYERKYFDLCYKHAIKDKCEIIWH